MGASVVGILGVIAEVVAALATAVAAAFAGYQVWELRQDRRLERQLEIDGVSVSWRNLEAPARMDKPATWRIEFSLVNPGRMPISDVRCEIQLAHPVRRLHYDGSLELPTSSFLLRSDVLPGGGERTWVRRVEAAAGIVPLAECLARVSFLSADGQQQSNVWPRSRRAGQR